MSKNVAHTLHTEQVIGFVNKTNNIPQPDIFLERIAVFHLNTRPSTMNSCLNNPLLCKQNFFNRIAFVNLIKIRSFTLLFCYVAVRRHNKTRERKGSNFN